MAARDTNVSIDEVAADWAAREDSGELSEQERRELAAWLQADTRHFGAYARARAVLAHFDRARGLGLSASRAQRPSNQPLWNRQRISGAVAALSLSIIVAAGLFVFSAPQFQGFETAIGEIRRNALDDGSTVTLNTASTVKARLSDDAREIILVEGEAMFDVAADKSRPFRVRAGDVTVTAVGTSFSVRLRAGGSVDVVVREGVVDVVREGARPIRVAANDIVRWETQGPPETVRQATEQIDRAIAWREGMIDLDGLTLAQAAAEFSRYGGKPILIPQPEVAAMKVTGLFSASDPAGFARAAALSLDLESQADGDAVTIIDSGP